jgi:multiple sugar transport system permease protein
VSHSYLCDHVRTFKIIFCFAGSYAFVYIRGMSVFRAIFYLPSLIGGSVAISAIWRNLFGADGMLNKFGNFIGIPGIDWINTPGTSLYTLVLLAVWQFGSSMVIFLAGLKQIPRDLYESASMDRASKFRSFFSITLPMLTPIILFNLVMQIIGSFQMFTQAFIITKGGPINSTLVYALYLYQPYPLPRFPWWIIRNINP